MFGLSLFEIIFLAGLALIVLGPKQLPEVARTLGRFLTELRRTSNMMMADLQESAKADPVKKPPPPSPPSQVPPTPHSQLTPVAHEADTSSHPESTDPSSPAADPHSVEPKKS